MSSSGLSRFPFLARAVMFGALAVAPRISLTVTAEAADEEPARLADRLHVENFAARSMAAFALIERGAAAREFFPVLAQALCDDEALDYVVAGRALYARPRPATDAPMLIAGLALGARSRAAAAWELSRIGLAAGSETTRALLAALGNPDKHERNFTVVAIAVTGPPTRDAVSSLLEVLRDAGDARSPQTNYKYPRAAAAIALGLTGAAARDAAPALTEMLGEKSDWEFQLAANCFALGRIGSAESLLALQRELQNSSPFVRARALDAIQAIAPPGTATKPTAADIGALTRALVESPSRVNPRFVEGLRVLGAFAGTSPAVGKKGSHKAALPVHESISLAIGYLDSLPRPPAPEEIERQEQAGALNVEVKQYVMALGGIQQSIAPVLLEALAQGEQDPRIRAVRRLAVLGPAARAATPALLAALADADWIVRRDVFLAQRRLESPAAAPESKEFTTLPRSP